MLASPTPRISRRCFAAIAAVVMAAACAHAARPLQAGYSTEPVRAPIFDEARVAVEVAAFTEWLNGNYEALGEQQRRGPRDHLYYLIDSRVKHLFASTGAVKPAGEDLLLTTLFGWAERLGVYGGTFVSDSFRPANAPAGRSTLPVPESFRLKLDADVFELSSPEGEWSVEYPYYFMTWKLDDFEATSGMRTQMAVISTGAARHKGVEGYSQATLMLMFGPAVDHEAFAEYWSRQVGVGDRLPAGTTDLANVKTRVLHNPANQVQSELVIWQTPKGSFALMYSGVDGTHQWNRAHFLDFFRNLRANPAR